MIALAIFVVSSLILAIGATLYGRVLEPFTQKYSWTDSISIRSCVFFCTVLAVVIWLFDVAYNVTFGSIIFAQLPFKRDPQRRRVCVTFSDRLQHICTAHEFFGTLRKCIANWLAGFVNRLWPNHIHM